MHNQRFDQTIARGMAIAIAGIIALLPFHAILTVSLSQLVGHYTLLRLWKEGVLVLLVLGSAYFLIRNYVLALQIWQSWAVRLIVSYLLLQVVAGLIAYRMHQVSGLALGYGWISNTRYLVFFITCLVGARYVPSLGRKWWQYLVFVPLVFVVLFGLLQYFVLPYDFLKHLGYGAHTIFPYEDINDNVRYIRVISTLRGANPLGAYLVMGCSLVGAVLLAMRKRIGVTVKYAQKFYALGLLVVGSLVVLVLTFSRAAWLGLGASVLVLAKPGNVRRYLWPVVGLLVLAAGVVMLLHYSTALQDVFLHTEQHSRIAVSSNAGHASALQQGIHDVLHEPLGRGPGTAGPASVYNTGHQTRIAENYYLQIAQETGWLGLALFLGIILLVARALWWRRDQTLAFGLLAGLVGLSAVNLFSHAWADDTLAYLWWGLAGIAIARPMAKPSKRSAH